MSDLKQVKTILLADDDADDRFFFQKAVSYIPDLAKLEMVVDGEKLMHYLIANTAHLPDVVVIDLNMPRKNGIECLGEIKSNALLKHLTVIMWSTSLRDETANQLYSLGAHYYMHKCDYLLLTQNITLLLDLLAQNPDQPPKNKFILGAKETIS